jgi:hypothetical protein
MTINNIFCMQHVNLNLYTQQVDIKVMFYICIVDVLFMNLGQNKNLV